MKKLYQMNIKERLDYIDKTYDLDNQLQVSLSDGVIDTMIENAVGVYEVPLGVVEDFKVNDTSYLVPLSTEEPSVIAALNKGNKLIQSLGSLSASVDKKTIKGQVAFLNPTNLQVLVDSINKEEIMKQCETIYPSIYKRGGGVIDITTKINQTETNTLVVVELEVDTKDAMGANIVNSLMEGVRTYLENLTDEESVMAILTNANDTSIVDVKCTLDMSKIENGDNIGRRIEAASIFSQMDSNRAVTHNKGIMNGIEAITLATGNDTRAVSASIYSYTGLNPLSIWSYNHPILTGTMQMPITIGTVGGSIQVHPKAKMNIKALNVKDSKELMEVIASVGLVQNFSALYALVTDGIQKGHMNLQLKNLAYSLEATPEEIIQLQMHFKNKTFNKEQVSEILTQLRQSNEKK